ncbi:hypothetical protein [Candidatus Mycobacterium methanotrophicum]|uniref:Uncharacterized protein n=1 Tax=Candidatus Mycobacterium methanotrophicum TaxID=2943498 RepID=A0ABY4QIY6_9MYCO|nr:hypothetical protein [Candidatus Mycobacterium methanotrophicum]UQX09640.1 hypothetical protein M5I08_14955 [Candidatus Mycobacterium methanotrophicum]
MPHGQVRDVRLAGTDAADAALGDGAALVIGGSGIPIPPQTYVDAADTMYLQPRGFTGIPQALDTPEGFYPTTGVDSPDRRRLRSSRRPDPRRGDHRPDSQRRRRLRRLRRLPAVADRPVV